MEMFSSDKIKWYQSSNYNCSNKNDEVIITTQTVNIKFPVHVTHKAVLVHVMQPN